MMDEAEKEKLDRCYFTLVREIDCSPLLLANLYQDGILSHSQQEELLNISLARKRRRRLLEILPSCTYENSSPFNRFLHILEITGQEILGKQLKEGVFEQKAHKERQEVDWQLRLKKCRVTLVQDLDLGTPFLDFLYQEGLLVMADLERLSDISAPNKTTSFLNTLSHKSFFFKKGTNAEKVFVKALEEYSSPHLADAFRSVVITAEDYSQHEEESHGMLLEEMLHQDFKYAPDSSVPLSLVKMFLQKRYEVMGRWFTVEDESILKHIRLAFDGTSVRNQMGWFVTITNLTCKDKEKIRERKENQVNDARQMMDWTPDEVEEWAHHAEIAPSVVKEMRKNGIDGKDLYHCTEEDLGKIGDVVRSKPRCYTIVEEKDKYLLAQASRQVSILANDETLNLVEESDHVREDLIMEAFREFDKPVEITEKYKRHAKFPESESRVKSQLDPVRKYVHYKAFDVAGECITQLGRKLVLFAAACLNERSNGVLYVGVKNSEVLGVSLGDPSVCKTIEQCLLQSISKSFYEDQLDMVLRCIRPVKCIEVVPRTEPMQYVLEIDIVPSHELCENEIFFVRPLSNRSPKGKGRTSKPRIYTLKNTEPVECNVKDYWKMQPRIIKFRERQEARELQKKKPAIPGDLSSKLKYLLCQGETTLKGDRYPILVIPPLDASFDEQYVRENLSFLKGIKWKVVLDFGSDGKIYKFMESEEFRIKYGEEFDSTSEKNVGDPTLLPKLKAEFQGPHPLWLFANGYENAGKSLMNLREWKQNRKNGILEFLQFYKTCLNPERVTVIFLLLSKDFSVMVDVADSMCAQYPEQFVCIAEDNSIAMSWSEKLLSMQCISSETLESQMVAGLLWSHTAEIVHEISGKEPTSQLKLPTVHGTFIDLPERIKNQLYDLEIVGATHCDNSPILKNKDELKEFKREKEEQFYRGAKVDWWNFWFQTQVNHRVIHNNLRSIVTKCLSGDLQEEDNIRTVTLYHQPGCGGSTTARNILWDLRQSYRCAEVVNISENTCDQIFTLRCHGESGSVLPKPTLLLLDNVSVDQVQNLLASMRQKAKQRTRNFTGVSGVFFVLLMANRTSKMPKKIGSQECCFLEQKLKDSERIWFIEKYKAIENEGEIDPKTLISFNILKENCDEGYISRTVQNYVEGIDSSKEKTLLKFLALLNYFDVGKRPVPVAAFDKFMGGKGWETILGTEITLLVNVNSKDYNKFGFQTISMSHSLIGKAVLSVFRLLEGKGLLSKFTLSCFEHYFVGSRGALANGMLLERIGEVLRHREYIDEGRAKFSPIIEKIVQAEGLDRAAEVLKKGFKITQDAFVAQQVARVYIEAKAWDLAEEYAEKATRLNEKNCYLRDTCGQVIRWKFHEWKLSLENKAEVSDEDVLHGVKLAYAAIRIFREVIDMAKDMDVMPSTAGYIGALQVFDILLDCLTLHSAFGGKPTGKMYSKEWRRFFTDKSYVPSSLMEWREAEREDYVEFLKSVKDDSYKYLSLLEDDASQMREIYVDEHHEMQSMRFLRNRMVKLKSAIHSNFAWEPLMMPGNLTNEEKMQIRRAKMYRVGGMTLRSLIDIPEESILASLHNDVRENLGMEPDSTEDIQYFISVCLAISCRFPSSALANGLSLKEMASLSKRLYFSRSTSQTSLEPYLYFIMFNWPLSNPKSTVLPKEITNAFVLWANAFHEKYPQQKAESKQRHKRKATTVFYLGSGTGMQSFQHSGLLQQSVNIRGSDRFWNDPIVTGKLKRFTGTLTEQGERVLMDVQYGNEKFNIATSYPIDNSVLWSKQVSFFVGLSWMGPRAYDIKAVVE